MALCAGGTLSIPSGARIDVGGGRGGVGGYPGTSETGKAPPIFADDPAGGGGGGGRSGAGGGGGGGSGGSLLLAAGSISIQGHLEAGGGLGGSGASNFGSGGFGGTGRNGGASGGKGGGGGDGGDGGDGGHGFIRIVGNSRIVQGTHNGHLTQADP